MTSKFSIDNRELLQRISSGEAVVGIDFGNLIVRELAAFRLAAMDSEPVEMPLDYLQGHKDGLEWAAQLAEANHPETGDWLYDDPIELAKAIRKGPDMPPSQPALDTEPVALQPELAKVVYHFRDWNEGFPVERFKADYVISWMLANYPPAQPAKDREQVRREHAEWSQATFGNVGPVGPLKHLSKEALEAAAEPGDLSEWADMQFLLWDAQRRAGVTDEQITQAMIEKLAVNKQREWPEPKDGEPRLHIKAQPAPITSVCTCPSGDGSLRWPCPVHPGNSPVTQDGWTGNDKANAALMMLDRIETVDPVDDDRIDGIKRIVRELAAAPQEVK